MDTNQAKSFRAAATKSLNSSFKGPKKPLTVVSKQKSEEGQNVEESDILAEAICDIFSQAVKIPIVAETPEQDANANGDENSMENDEIQVSVLVILWVLIDFSEKMFQQSFVVSTVTSSVLFACFSTVECISKG